MSCFDGRHPMPGSDILALRGWLGRTSVILALACAAGSAPADKFVMRSGQTVDGAIESESSTHYTVRTDVGSIRVSKADVSRYVSEGSTAEELEGDIAARKNDTAVALGKYQIALSKVPGDSLAAGRLQNKIGKINSLQQRAATGSVANEFARIQQLIQTRQYDPAQQALSSLRNQLPQGDPLTSQVQRLLAQVHYSRATAAQDAVRMDIAEQELQNAVAADPGFYPAIFKYGEMLMGSSATDARGIELIERGLQAAGPNLPDGERYKYHYMIARRYSEKGDHDKAASNFAEVISGRERFPAYGDALDRTVDAYVKMGEQNISSDFQKTIKNLNDALALNPRNQKALILLGRIYRDTGQIENAIITLNRLVQMDPTYSEAHHVLGRAYLDAGDFDQALTHLTMELEAHADNFDALLDRAELYIQQGEFTKAQADVTAARAIEDENWQVDYLEALLNYKQAKYAEAQTALTKALTQRSDAVQAHLLMGRVLQGQNQPEAARQWFEQVAKVLGAIDSLSYRYKVYKAEALTELGNLDMDQNSPRQAATRYTEALASLPDFAPALHRLGEVKARLASEAPDATGRQQLLVEAEDHFKRAVASEPSNADYILSLAVFYHRDLKDSPRALAHYNMYVDKGGRDPQVNNWLAEVGGTARPEITAIAAQTAPSTATLAFGAAVTTATLPMDPNSSATAGMLPTAPVTTATLPTAPGGGVPVAILPPPGQPVPAVILPPAPGAPIPGAPAPGAALPTAPAPAAAPAAPPI